ncbi:hypothetical protein NE683_15145 [Bariatricus massiliensis]|nr:hypothetical protein [Bariatricus massiliensis]MCQ5254561.1 hypothetical protein [Bariatricus massiliensis]MDY2662831.1 hypothetical protein [Bariatricus massiliensis]
MELVSNCNVIFGVPIAVLVHRGLTEILHQAMSVEKLHIKKLLGA